MRLYAFGDRPADKWIFIHAFVVCFFLPVAGQILLLGSLLLAMNFPAGSEQRERAFVKTPQFPTHRIPELTYGVIARLRTQLSHQGVSADDRMAAMVAMRSLPLHLTGEILRQLLSDPSEEIRLLAYGIAESAEKTLMQQIFACKERLNERIAPIEQAVLTSRLADCIGSLFTKSLCMGRFIATPSKLQSDMLANLSR